MSGLTGMQAQIFLYCDEIHSFENILSRFPRTGRGPLRDFLDMLYQR